MLTNSYNKFQAPTNENGKCMWGVGSLRGLRVNAYWYENLRTVIKY